MILTKMVGATAVAGALGLSAIGLAAGLANAAPASQDGPGVVQHAQSVDWHGGGRGGGRGPGGPGWGGPGGPGWGDPGWGAGWGGDGPGLDWGAPPPPCFLGVCL
jgi:hypothetical protein